jgi:prophage regulatory protein
VVPVSSATLWRWVKAGTFPAPVKLSSGMTAWRVGDVRAWMQARKKSENR